MEGGAGLPRRLLRDLPLQHRLRRTARRRLRVAAVWFTHPTTCSWHRRRRGNRLPPRRLQTERTGGLVDAFRRAASAPRTHGTAVSGACRRALASRSIGTPGRLTVHGPAQPDDTERPAHRDRPSRVAMMSRAVAQACEALDLEVDEWRLPLSGGKDDGPARLPATRRSPSAMHHLGREADGGLQPDERRPRRRTCVAQAIGRFGREYFVVDRFGRDPVRGRSAATSPSARAWVDGRGAPTWMASRCGARCMSRGWSA